MLHVNRKYFFVKEDGMSAIMVVMDTYTIAVNNLHSKTAIANVRYKFSYAKISMHLCTS